MELCGLLATRPYLAANVGSGAAREIAGWMEYLNPDEDTPLVQERRKNGHPAPCYVSWWGIGNESWGGGGSLQVDGRVRTVRRVRTRPASAMG